MYLRNFTFYLQRARVAHVIMLILFQTSNENGAFSMSYIKTQIDTYTV